MTHTISPVYHRGVLYGFYQAGELHTVEDVADPTEVMRLSIIPWKGKPSERRYLDVGALACLHALADAGEFFWGGRTRAACPSWPRKAARIMVES